MREFVRPVIIGVAAIAALLSSALALAQDDPLFDSTEPVVVAVERDGEEWRATFSFPQSSPVWAFHRSALRRDDRQPWRPESWRVVTPGVTLERVGAFDALVAAEGDVPGEVEIAFTPAATDLLADYDPAVAFSNGAIALYAGHFTSFPVASVEQLAGLTRPEGFPSRIGMRDAGHPVIAAGEIVDAVSDAGERYVIFGEVESEESARVTTILDPGLPEWLQGQLRDFSATTFDSFAAQLGDHGQGTPTVLASWAGATPGTISLGGSVTTGMVAMRLEGAGLLDPNQQALQGAQRFIAHEGAHFWLGQALAYDDRRGMWITEGGADMMAEILMAGLSPDPAAHRAASLASWRDRCATFLPNGALWGAVERQEFDAFYSCGAIFASVVDAAGADRGEDFFDFLSQLIERHRGGRVTSEDWLGLAGEFGVDEGRLAIMRRLLAEGSAEPAADLAGLLDA